MASQCPESAPRVIGRKEYVAFPEWGIRRVRAKVDTGACTSALDVRGYEVRPQTRTVWLQLPLSRRHPERVKEVEAPLVRMVTVRNSGGVHEQRPMIEALLRMGPMTKRVQLTVTNRSAMRHRMILGRRALAGCFVVDVARKYVLGEHTKV